MEEAFRAQEAEKARQAAQEAKTRRFEAERATLILSRAADQAKNQGEWCARTAERNAAWEAFRK